MNLTKIKKENIIKEKIESFSNLKTNQNDFIIIHTKHALRLWEGNNNPEIKKYQRYPGIKYGINLTKELVDLLKKDNPYAQYFLCKFEQKLNEAIKNIEKNKQAIEDQIKEYETKGIFITILENENPLKLQLYNIQGYGFKLIKLLILYDQFVKILKTLSTKGVISNTKANKILYDETRKIRSILLFLYKNTMQLRYHKININKRIFLENNIEKISELVKIVKDKCLPVLPVQIITNELFPEVLKINNFYKKDEQNLIITIAKKYGLVSNEKFT